MPEIRAAAVLLLVLLPVAAAFLSFAGTLSRARTRSSVCSTSARPGLRGLLANAGGGCAEIKERSGTGKLVVVTGGNRGIGYEICRQLTSKGYQVLLTSRNPSAGKRAVNQIQRQQHDLLVQRHQAGGGHQLDVTDPQSIKRLVLFVRDNFGTCAALINNAAVANNAADPLTAISAQRLINTNCFGALHVTRGLMPLLEDTGRVVMVSSRSAAISRFAQPLHTLLDSAASHELALEALMKKYIDELDAGRWREGGWPSAGLSIPKPPFLDLPADANGRIHVRANSLGVYLTAGGHHTSYCVSKGGMNAVTRLLAVEALGLLGPGVCVNACCPGWVQTSMAGPLAPSTVSRGAATPVYLVSQEVQSTGNFFAESRWMPFSANLGLSQARLVPRQIPW
eukprot:CAMPEP_0179423626 /NCGR_PEP_ID=MMETSP0799-20121207/11120_1 /TAXON_ID=46947 /ORGANISM="Geminigera cryophila, Strain CCMP2564" /LENGTH=395 /DNA_ID=CAMNT_0021197953 /DNA_START=63 /DNA_END=1251 /DNA_ORIENTATION=-